MFCESDQLYDGNKYNNDDDDDDDDEDEDDEDEDSDREEIESALYAQIHFHHEEDVKDGNLSYNGYSTSVQTVCRQSIPAVRSQENTPRRSTLTQSGTATSPICLPSSPSSCTNNTVSCMEESTYFVSDDSDFTDSECMILDKTLTNIGDIMVHVHENQQPILQAAQTTSENDKWKIADQITCNNPTLPRYYNAIPVRCYNCKELGHISNVCPKPKKSEICHLCGMTGHFFRKCPKGICYNCEGPGHNSYDCPKQRKQRGQTCFRCLMPGHSKISCPDIWRQFHMTTSEGPVQKMEMKQNPKRFCSNCASRKHFGFECVEDRMERHENGYYPFISTYTHTDPRSARDKSSQIKLKTGKKKKKKKHENYESNHWGNQITAGSNRGMKRKHRDDSEHHMPTGKRRKRQNKFNRDEDPHVQPKSQKKKNKQRRTRWDNREETENYPQPGKKTQNKGRKESVSKITWQTYNTQYKNDKPYNSDKGFKTSRNTTNNYNKGFKTSFYQNKIPDY
ncbi:zinc finger CCHC domain-containing protein 7-like [Pecten maximus]|uniref:zinc finger CCHC domain-containing protein 7-like n=1 Tax=Pecten maximus TaxID=6579 RepID=UPI0014590474|nr:zinc finger CCHC domain-containing protein 7-like [Pecten maximus]